MSKETKKIYYMDGVPVPETPEPGTEPGPWGQTDIVGKKIPRVDGYERVSGTAVYPSDVLLPGMLYGAIVRCPHPHARVKRISTRQAETMPGVRAVLTKDSPEASGIKWPYSQDMETQLFDPLCRFEGETVAAVAADTQYQAWDAARSIEVEYEVLPFVADERRALEQDAPEVHAGGNSVSQPQTYQRGDLEQGFSQADVVLEHEYRTRCEIHTPMELHGCVAKWDGDTLVVWESSQGVYAVQSKLAKVLGLPLSKVRVIGHYMGGGFGSKLQPGKYTVIGSLLAKKTARPVKMLLTREETYLAVGNRPPSTMRLKAGIRKDGTLTGLDFECLGTGGAYPAGGTALVDWLIRDLYTCENVRTRTQDVYINAGPARPFRAPGHPQASWALEQMLDELGEKIGMDPVQVRLKNIPEMSQTKGKPYTTTGLRECIVRGAKAFGWEEARKRSRSNPQSPHIKRGSGMGSCLWFAGDGGPPSTVIVKLFSDGSANLNMGASDIGTGTKTVMALVVAEELGLKPDMVQIENADTKTTQYATPSGGSKTVPTEAPAVRNASVQVKQQLLEMAAKDLDADVSTLRLRGPDIVSTTDPSKSIKVTDISKLNDRGVLMGVGYRGPNTEDKVINPFAAQFCEVEVDTKTGEVKILRFVAAHDSGRVMDRLTYDNQVFGGIAMGIGLAMTEYRILDEKRTGKMVNKNWHDYKLPTMMDVPVDMVSLPVELEDPEANNTGAKGLGEPVTIPTAAAIANAVYDAIGIRVRETPVNPFTLSRLLADRSEEV